VANTQHRQIIILQNIPRYPKKICTRELLEKVNAQGIEASMRTIQRDLERMSGSGLFAIGADASSKPIGWYLMKDSPEPDLSVMDINTAIAFELMRISVEELLPRTTRQHIEPYFSLARQLLEGRNNWYKKIAYSRKPDTSLLDITEEDRDLLFEAIDKEMCISASIGHFNENQITYKFADVIHPLGLMVSERRTYLVFTLYAGKKIFSAPLHRIQQVSILPQKVLPPKNFDLEYYVNSDPLSRCYERSIQVVMEVSNSVANYLYENPLGYHQEIITLDRNRYRVSATVDDTDQLRSTLRSFGEGASIISPEKIKFQIHQ
jgi:predicted DNA-binding transcriptional regulator YafY